MSAAKSKKNLTCPFNDIPKQMADKWLKRLQEIDKEDSSEVPSCPDCDYPEFEVPVDCSANKVNASLYNATHVDHDKGTITHIPASPDLDDTENEEWFEIGTEKTRIRWQYGSRVARWLIVSTAVMYVFHRGILQFLAWIAAR